MGKFKQRGWTDEEETLLKEMWYDRKFTLKQIEEVLGRSENSIRGKRKSLDLPPRQEIEARWHWEDVQKRYHEVIRA